MFAATRGSTVRLIALAALLAVLLSLVGSAQAAPHRHDGPGLYDANCPLVALGAVHRTGLVVALVSAPLVAVSALVSFAIDGRRLQAPAGDVRLRAPPVR